MVNSGICWFVVDGTFSRTKWWLYRLYIYIYTDGLIYPLGDLISCDVMLVKGDLLNKHEDLSVWLPVCLSACMPLCLHACMSVCLYVWMHACMHVYFIESHHVIGKSSTIIYEWAMFHSDVRWPKGNALIMGGTTNNNGWIMD
jgi:hypothetical protein